MNVEELYALIDGDYDEVLKRLPGEEFVARFIVKFADDTSCPDTVSSWREGDEGATFESAHKAKGVCANLSLRKLADITSMICEALRPGNNALREATDIDALVNELDAAHQAALEAITSFSDQRA